MSKADEMFEELGYKKEEHNYHACGKVIEYHNEINSPFDFMIDRKEIKIWEITIGIKELQAINEKCKELGWL